MLLIILVTYIGYGSSLAQTRRATSAKNEKAVKAYTTAISEYINAIYKPGVLRPDTLFINKNIQMPAIALPPSIQGIGIVTLPGERSFSRLRGRSSSVLLNIPGWLDGDKPEFVIVTFKDLKPQHNCSMYLKYNADRTNFILDSMSFEYPYGKK